MTNIDIKAIKTEWTYFLRNSDIFTTTIRSVTTDTDTGTFAADSTHLIAVTNIKNIRSVVVGGVTLTYGSDYTYDIDFLDTTIKTKITFTSAQTGAYTITYDYGTDKIFPDYPRDDLTISSYPRISSDIIYSKITPAGHQNTDLSVVGMSTTVYSKDLDDIDDYITSIRSAIKTAYISFYYVGKYVHVIHITAKTKSPYEKGKDKIWQCTIDTEGDFNYEK